MSIESLIERILADARKAAAEVEKKASGEAKTFEEETDREIRRIMDAAKQGAARIAREQKQRMISMAELDDRKAVLGMKQQVIEEAFDEALKKILALDGKAYGTFVGNLILQANPNGDEEVVFNSKDRDRFGDGWIREVNERLGKGKKKGTLRIAREARPIQGGAILKRGRKEINCSLESVFLCRRAELETKVAGILFKDSE
jgi:V/A-type H+-transporting ATPase subunit E